MALDDIQYVSLHPPRCITTLNPKPVEHSKPTLLLPRHLTIYHDGYDPSATASFIIGCPCGCRSVHLRGYYTTSKDSNSDGGFVGPLSIECTHCSAISEFFDTRKHGYDGEQGVNTYIVGKGKPDSFICLGCRAAKLLICANFSYQAFENFGPEMRKQPQDYFDTLDIVGQCMHCHALIEVTSFECA